MGDVRSKSFPSDPQTASNARHWVQEVVGDLDWDGEVDDAVLLVSELVTNALLHAQAAVRVTLYRHDEGLWVSVTDGGAGRIVRRQAEPTDTIGRGLEIVDRMSGAWGVLTEPETKSVWFELTAAR